MRLLQLQGDGEFNLIEFLGNNVPDYAILSHTWGSDNDEVTYQDMSSRTGKHKAGYHKIRFCGKQAKKDGIDFFWVDTCCIDKASSSELSEAINSMFRWYQNAKRCYVYLSDVSSGISDKNDECSRRWKSAFKKSRWFTRGWTLQELIAPLSVEFFSMEEERLGDKNSLEQTIHEVTGVASEVLKGRSLCQFSIDERFSWASKRQTKREEDTVYCLLGIFDIHMSLIYGEGRQKALKRLRKEIRETLENAGTALNLDSQSRSQGPDEKLTKIRQWLSAPDPSTNYQKAFKQRQADTGLWFLESERYTKWKTDAASPLWLYGIPGCGKTVLSSTILHSVLQHCHDHPGKVTAYFYFDFNDKQKQDPELMLRSLVCQLLQQSTKISASLETLFSSCDNGERSPSVHALLKLLQHMAGEFLQVYIVLDALDECAQRKDLMDMLEIIARWQLQNLRLLFTSRREWDIESSLEDIVDLQNWVCLQSKVVDEDIQRYVRQRLSDDKSLRRWERDIAIKQEIEIVLMQGARGMFRWAVCQLDALGKCRSRAVLRKSLATLPPTLDRTYDRILSAINKEDSEYAIRILQWLTFSARPLSIDEVAEVVAIDIEHDPTFDGDEILEDPLDILNICSSLVTMNVVEDQWQKSPRRIVALAHYSVKEYLLSDRIWKGEAAQYGMQDTICHEVIARGCLGYLFQFQQPELDSDNFPEIFKLATYSAEFWVSHAHKTGDRIKNISQVAIRLFSTENPAYLNWIRLYNPDTHWPDFPMSREKISHPLYYAALLGLRDVVSLLLENGSDPNEVLGGYYGNPLNAASHQGHEQVVNLLLNKGADPNPQGKEDGNPLYAAVLQGHEHILKLLLDKGADPNVRDGDDDNPLYKAVERGHEQVVKLLLDKGANPNTQVRYYHNPLYTASEEGYEQVVKLLLDKGADPNVEGGEYGNALQAASHRGHDQVVKLLLNKGADMNAQSGHYGNPLYTASERGHEQVVKLLLAKGANANAQSGYYGNPLQAALERGHKQVVKLLIDKDARSTSGEDMSTRT